LLEIREKIRNDEGGKRAFKRSKREIVANEKDRKLNQFGRQVRATEKKKKF